MLGKDVRVGPAEATEWLARVLLPALLRVCDRDVAAGALEEHAPIRSRSMLRDRYAMARLATTLREIRDELADSVQLERIAADGEDHTTVEPTWSAQSQAAAFPHLDRLCSFAVTAAPVHDVGARLRATVQLAIDLIIARHNTGLPGLSASPDRIGRLYDEALLQLVALCTPTAAAA